MADDTVYTISVHEGSAKSWAIGRIEMLGSNLCGNHPGVASMAWRTTKAP